MKTAKALNKSGTSKPSDRATSRPSTTDASPKLDLDTLNRITDRAFYMALEMIDAANSRPEKEKAEPKVGGHPSACASSQHILTAIHLVLRKPEDYFAFKPHLSPMDHALNYLLRNFREKDGSTMSAERSKLAMRHLRHYSKTDEPVFQSYHAESDPDGFRYFPSGSVGIPPVNALYTSLAYDFARDHDVAIDEDPIFWCLMGDSEFREGSLMEAMPDAGDRQLGNLVWIVDYNRQNLDGTRIVNEKALGGTDADRILGIAKANGWEPILLKHGRLREKMFALPGGEEFRRVLDEELPDFELQALITANKPELTREQLGRKSPALKKFLAGQSDSDLQAAFLNVAGHDLGALVDCLSKARTDRTRPKLIVAYTIKGKNLLCQAMSGNHSAMPERAELDAIASRIGADAKEPFAEFSETSAEARYLRAKENSLVRGIDDLLETIKERREKFYAQARTFEWPVDFDISALKFAPMAHTQWMWGQIAAKLDRLARGEAQPSSSSDKGWSAVAPYFLTMAPDVGSSTNTSPNMNGKLYGDIGQEDFELQFGVKDTKAPDVVPHANRRTGHLRFEIAEGNCMSAVGSFGKMFYFTGIPFYPAMTIYDFFIKRCHDQLYYNQYWHSHFATLGTPSGITLAPEGAQHSWKSDLQIPNGITWEPCFAKELEWILADTLRRHFTGEDANREAAIIRCVTKGVTQKELLDRLKLQPRFRNGSLENPPEADAEILEKIREEALCGGYCLIDYRDYPDYVPGDNAVHLFAMGALVVEAIRASDALKGQGIFANVFVVTSPDLLLGSYGYKDGYQHLRQTLGVNGDLHLVPGKGERLESPADWFYVQGGRVPVVSVHDGEAGLLDNIGSIVGVKQEALAVRKTSKSGTTWDIFELHGLDSASIAQAAERILRETAGEQFRVSRGLKDLLLDQNLDRNVGGSWTPSQPVH